MSAVKQTKRPLLTFAVGLVGLIVLILMAEMGLRIHDYYFSNNPRSSIKHTTFPGASDQEPRVRVFEQWGDNVLDRTWKETNVGNLRWQPASKAKPTKHAIFFGDSETYGQGTGDDETYPYFFSQLNPEYKTLNFGLRGGSVNSIFHVYSKLPIRDGSLPPEGFAAYYFFKQPNIKRLNYYPLVKNLFRPDEPFYDLDENKKLRFLGYPQETQPLATAFFRFFWNLESTSLYFKHEARSLARTRLITTPADEELATTLLLHLAQSYRTDFPNGRFLLLTSDEEDEFYSRLAAKGLEVVHLELGNLRKPEHLHPYSLFRNAKGNRELAVKISESIKKNRAQP